MGSTSAQKEIAKTEVQTCKWKERCLQRKGQRQASRGCASIWATTLACYFSFGPAMDESQHHAYALTVPAPAAASGESNSDKERDKQFRSLVAALKKHTEELPDDVQQVMKEMHVRSGQEETKLLHSAVSQHGRAKKEVQEAQSARFQMHTAWRNFLSQSAQQWQKYAAQFMEQEKLLTERFQAAKENLTAAKENLCSCKVAAGLDEKEDHAMQSDSQELVNKDSQTAAGKRIAASFTSLSTSLQALHSQAGQAVQQEEEDQLRKRQRIASPSEPAAAEPGASKLSFGGAE